MVLSRRSCVSEHKKVGEEVACVGSTSDQSIVAKSLRLPSQAPFLGSCNQAVGLVTMCLPIRADVQVES
jgi:hypothetical protein